MSSDEPIRSVPDELFQQVTAKPERQLPDALFGAPSERKPDAPKPADRRSDDADRAVPDELFQQVTAKPERQLPDALFGGPPAPKASDVDEPEADPPEASGDENLPGTDSADATDVLDVESVEFAGESGAESVSGHTDGSADGIAENDSAGTMDDTASRAASEASAEVPISEQETAEAAGDESGATSEQPSASGDEKSARPILLVIADSLSYFGPKGGLPANHPRIWPNLVAAELDWDVELVGRIGWTCRDAYWALIGDPRVWAAVPNAGAVVFAVGGMDTLPSPLPTALRELIRYVRPPWLRRVVRGTYNWLQPKLSRLGRPVALPPKVSVDYLEQAREALAQLRPDLPFVAVLPSVHNCDAYGRVHRGRPRAVRALEEWSARTNVPLVDLAEAVRDNIFSGDANPDGIHWGWAGHSAVATAMAKTLHEVR